MDSGTAAIEQEAAFAFEDATEVPLLHAPVSQVVPSNQAAVDSTATDFSLCQLAAAFLAPAAEFRSIRSC